MGAATQNLRAVRGADLESTTRPTVRTRPKKPQGPLAKARVPGRLGRAGRVAGRVGLYLLPFVLLGVLAASVGYVRLHHGAVSLKFIAEPIERGISAGLGGMAVRIDDALLTLGENGGIEFQLTNLSLAEADGDLVASAPLATIELSAGSFWAMRVEPARVFLIEPRLSLTYAKATGLQAAFTRTHVVGEEPASTAESAEATASAPAAPEGAPVTLDIAKIISEGASRARSGQDATTNLREIGVRNALVSLDYEGVKSEWRVAEAAIDLEHKRRRSVISGSARIVSQEGPWAVSFHAEDSERKGAISLQVSVRDLVPRSLARAIPTLGFLESADLSVAADASFELSHSGSLLGSDMAVALGAGQFNVSNVSRGTSTIDAGLISLHYSAPKGHVVLQPSTIKSGESSMTLEGIARRSTLEGRDGLWNFELTSKDGTLAAEEFDVHAIPASVMAKGTYNANDGSFLLGGAKLKAGEAEIAMTGEMRPSASGTSTRFEGRTSPMGLDVLKVLWPRSVAPVARDWVGKSMSTGRVHAGTLTYANGMVQGTTATPAPESSRFSLAFELSDLQSAPAADTLAFQAQRALVRLEGTALEINVPDAAIVTGPGQSISLKSGRFTAVDLGKATSTGEAAFRIQAPLAATLAGLSQKPLSIVKPGDLPLDALDGKVDGVITVKMALGQNDSGQRPAVEGKVKFTDIKSKQKIGSLDLQSGTINVEITSDDIDAKGELVLNGAVAKVFWRRPLDESFDHDAPVKILATLDNTDRNQVGLDVNHIVQGDVGLEITVTPVPDQPPKVHVKADLTPSELTFEDMAWVKLPGRKAILDLDVKKGDTNPLELHNIKLVGENIAVEGWAAIDSKNDLKEFFFPEFSVNVVSRLEVQGKLGGDRVWKVKASGPTFDGKDLFTSLVSLGGTQDRGIRALRPAAGMDVEATIGNVLGHQETSLRGVKLKMSQRNQKLSALDVDATIDGGKPFAALLRLNGKNQRVIYVESTDAGQAFKLANFYPNMQGGRVRLEVNLDGKGAAQRTGILWVEKFRVLGDPVVSEVLASSEGQSGKKVVREVYDFDMLRAPFSSGHEQLVLEDSQLRGPVVGATITGKVDFRSRRVDLGGTYIPLQGINSALCAIPLVGLIITGPKCDGVVGITYAIQGAMAQPQVIVNPLSMFTPGILKEIMQMTNPNQKVQARDDGRPKSPASERVGSSASEAVRADKKAAAPAGTPSQGIDGWTSQESGPAGN